MEIPWKTEVSLRHILRVWQSYHHWTDECLVDHLPPFDPDADILARALYHAPFALVSHGTEPDPILNYGNATALRLWEVSWEEFVRTPSRLTAEAPARDERARLLEAVTRDGHIRHYGGIRISRTGRRFRIHGATVWNLINENGRACGQAAMFREWEFL